MCIPTLLHRFQLREFVVALSAALTCASVAATPLYDIINSMPVNSWARINTNRIDSVWVPLAQSPGPSTPKYVIQSWNGGAWDPNHDYMYVWGGNGSPYAGNEVYRFSGTSLMWERAALPSQIKLLDTTYPDGKRLYTTVDGVDAAPMSAETYDSVVYLPGVDRLAVFGGSVWPGDTRDYVREDGVTRAGPYFWDPSKADPNMVGGATGSQVDPTRYPNVLGGDMWENRQSRQTEAGLVGPGTTNYGKSAATMIDGKDVVYFASFPTEGKLFRYTVNSLEDPSQDFWEVVGTKKGGASYSGAGAGAFDTSRNAFVQTANSRFIYWDLNTGGPNNRSVAFVPQVLGGESFTLSKKWGMDYDPLLDAFVLWNGGPALWMLTPPDLLGPQGWTLSRIFTDGLAPPAPTNASNGANGVYGKWNYMPDYGTYIGVVNALSGDVWLFKPGVDRLLPVAGTSYAMAVSSEVPLPAAPLLVAMCLIPLALRIRAHGAASGGRIAPVG